MTIKKSLISVAAAGAIAAMVTGCGSSSKSNNGTTSVKATDGYVLNYTATAILGDGNSSSTKTTEVKLPNAVKAASITAGAAQTAGSPVLDLSKDLTAAEIANLQTVKLAYKAQSRANGTTLIYGTFFDANGDSKFVAKDGDTLATAGFAMEAPAGYKNITPITTLIAARIATLTASDTNETNRTAVEALALTQISDALGLAADDIKNVDPIDAVKTNPAYTLVNSMLGKSAGTTEMTAIANSLATATKATDAVSALKNIAAGATASKAFYTNVADQFAADANMINTVASMNLDASRSGTTFTPISLATGSSDFNVTAVKVGSIETSLLAGTGAKAKQSDLNDVNLTMDFADANITNKPFTLAIKIGAQESTVASDANITSLTITVPFEMNNTEGTDGLEAAVSGDVSWEGVKADGSIFSGDMNKTSFNDKAPGAISLAGTSTITDTLQLKVADIITAIDTNSSKAAGIVDNNISSLEIALVDSNSSMQQLSGGKTVLWGNTQVAATGGTINVTGKTILKNSVLDARATATGLNVAPDNNLTIGTLNGLTIGTIAPNDTNATDRIVLNNNTQHELLISKNNINTYEQNTTAAFTFGAMLNDKNSSVSTAALKANSSATAQGGFFDVNTTDTTTIGELNTTMSTLVTDEFGDTNTTVTYITVNRAPEMNPLVIKDANLSSLLTDRPDGNSSMTLFTDLDGNTVRADVWLQSDINTTLYDINQSANTAADFNLSTAPTSNIDVWIENNTTLVFGCTKAQLDANISNSDTNISLIIRAVGDIYDANSTTTVDSNITFQD